MAKKPFAGDPARPAGPWAGIGGPVAGARLIRDTAGAALILGGLVVAFANFLPTPQPKGDVLSDTATPAPTARVIIVPPRPPTPFTSPESLATRALRTIRRRPRRCPRVVDAHADPGRDAEAGPTPPVDARADRRPWAGSATSDAAPDAQADAASDPQADPEASSEDPELLVLTPARRRLRL